MDNSNESLVNLIARLRTAEQARNDAVRERCEEEGLSAGETAAVLRKIADDSIVGMNARTDGVPAAQVDAWLARWEDGAPIMARLAEPAPWVR